MIQTTVDTTKKFKARIVRTKIPAVSLRARRRPCSVRGQQRRPRRTACRSTTGHGSVQPVLRNARVRVVNRGEQAWVWSAWLLSCK